MENDQLKTLETRIDDLITACERLKQENHSLRDGGDALKEEHADLMEKTRQAKTRIKSMIERLKALERST
ncbi:MAG: TIGR02449 family protein [Acidiferrobacterales bacterium]|nr:TIGR02449 family protein [Acidiferrobacterales bacterium]